MARAVVRPGQMYSVPWGDPLAMRGSQCQHRQRPHGGHTRKGWRASLAVTLLQDFYRGAPVGLGSCLTGEFSSREPLVGVGSDSHGAWGQGPDPAILEKPQPG